MKNVSFNDFYVCLMIFYVFLLILGDGGGDGDGRIFLEDPTPINPHRDNISRKGNPSLRNIHIYINTFKHFICTHPIYGVVNWNIWIRRKQAFLSDEVAAPVLLQSRFPLSGQISFDLPENFLLPHIPAAMLCISG